MSIVLFQILSVIAATSTALLAGIYFIFHNTVMIVLAEQDGIKTMNRINQVILNKTFLLIFMLSPLSSLLMLAIGLAEGLLTFHSPLLYGALLAILGFLITIRFNVPLNNSLALVTDSDRNVWEHYLVHWVTWNSRRFYLSIIAGAAIVGGFVF
ncbi:anthrone oxygenase family protein [Vibrio hangzhouensis]|uniref:Uncharacterized membrane protein n=1 Tax=Vibrio hangzhouensis TaxID=462991 RepID=A0A1H5SFV2_9VIBR|nr:anthrone oxygenase family protein [Vibrio hangzhouensis]SEF49476.1 Uncharacterized membrane protein [Vibrio hangzhouensis]